MPGPPSWNSIPDIVGANHEDRIAANAVVQPTTATGRYSLHCSQRIDMAVGADLALTCRRLLCRTKDDPAQIAKARFYTQTRQFSDGVSSEAVEVGISASGANSERGVPCRGWPP